MDLGSHNISLGVSGQAVLPVDICQGLSFPLKGCWLMNILKASKLYESCVRKARRCFVFCFPVIWTCLVLQVRGFEQSLTEVEVQPPSQHRHKQWREVGDLYHQQLLLSVRFCTLKPSCSLCSPAGSQLGAVPGLGTALTGHPHHL